MRAQFVTETIADRIPVFLVCASGVLKQTLISLLNAADFYEAEQGESPRVAIIIDTPNLHLPQLTLPEKVPVYLVKFGNYTSIHIPGATELVYEQVFSEVVPSLSALDEMTRRLMLDEKETIKGGEVAPLLLEDAFSHLVQELVKGKSKSGIFYGDKRISYTELIARIREQLKLGYGKKVKQVRVPLILKNTIPSRDIELLLAELHPFWRSLAPQKTNLVKAVIHTKNPKKVKIRNSIIAASFCGGLCLALGAGWYQWSAARLADQIKALAYPNSQNMVLDTSIQRTAGQLGALASVTDFLTGWLHPGVDGEVHSNIPIIKVMLEGASQLQSAQRDSNLVFQSIMREGKDDPFMLLKRIDQNLDNSYKNFSNVEARFVQNETQLPDILGGKSVQAQLVGNLPELKKNILTTRSLVAMALQLMQGKHSYALVLMDDSNLRGGGGVVESVAVLTFDSGKLLTYQVYPASVLSQMLTGEVQAPDEVKAYLRENIWSITDASWDYPFNKSAEHVLWFLGKELSRPIDGLIAIPMRSIPKILEATGPIGIGDVNKLSSGNFDSQRLGVINQLSKDQGVMEVWANKVFSALVDKLIHTQDSELFRVGGALVSGFNNSELTAGATNKEVQSSLGALAWDGNLQAPSCPVAFSNGLCRVSSMLEVENNVGQNNINAFISRSQVHTIRVGVDSILHNRILTLTNTNTQLTWPFGTYQSLVKFNIDNDAMIQGLSINNQVLTPAQFSLLKVDGHLVVRVGVEVAPGATVRVKLLYVTPGIPNSNSSLVFFEQKQPGVGDDPFSLIITYPDSFTPKSVAPRAVVGRTSLTFTSNHDSNHLFAVGF